MRILIAAILTLPLVASAKTADNTAAASAAKKVEKKMLTVKAASLYLCPYKAGKPVLMGCTDRILITKKTNYLFDLDETASEEIAGCLNRLVGSYHFHGLRKSPDFDVTGYVTKEKGHFPNPTVEFNVFHIVDSKKLCLVPVPR